VSNGDNRRGAPSREWVAGPALRAGWMTPAPRTVAADVEQFPAAIVDPFA
jgi:hypothetical protein